ncbi:FUSC family protein [Agromyces sp. H66]|uniref:FUSC family protein n=1 Tax=Agromyces sp. H66 TaxID=2529859 RepID=UPI0010AA5C49|nr:FUSC family protein [Agromyces sp. H66]
MTVAGRLAARSAAGWSRLRDSLPAILRITVTAAAAYAFARFVVGHHEPLIAAIVAITALGFVRDARPVRVFETVVAMTLGIALAEVLLVGFGQGVPQFAVALALTLAVARLVSANAAFAIAAAVQCTLVMLVPAPEGGPFVRTIDAAVGGAFALAATAIIPRDPRRASMREGRRLIAEHVAVLGELAEALRSGSTELAGQALSRARATQPLVENWTASVDSGLAVARISPLVRGSRFDLERQRVMLAGLDLATRNLRIIARRIEWVLRDGRPRPEVADVHARIAVAVGLLADSLRDVSQQPVARQAFAEITRHLDPVAILPDGSVGDRNTITALRPYLIDLLTSTGLALDDARSLLPSD